MRQEPPLPCQNLVTPFHVARCHNDRFQKAQSRNTLGQVFNTDARVANADLPLTNVQVV